jgi:AcrR family transcriptional regulator
MNQRAQQKIDTRARIISAASRLFKKHGFAATGVDSVMKAAGLTAGGFYAHFKSKDDLLAESLSLSLDESWARLTANLKGSPKEQAEQILARYLSPLHRDKPEIGCPLAGIAAELGRHSNKTTKSIVHHLERAFAEFEKMGIERHQAIAGISSALGALLLSRLVQGESLSDELLEAAKTPLKP